MFYSFQVLTTLYISPSLHAPKEELLHSLYKGQYYKSLYFIVLPQNKNNICEIISLKQIVNLSSLLKKLRVIGIAPSHSEAIALLVQILEDYKVIEQGYCLDQVFSEDFIDYKENKGD